jgi:hypothetical protein
MKTIEELQNKPTTNLEPELGMAVREPANGIIRTPTSLEILDAAVRGGVTSENVAVVKEIIAMRREELAHESKAKFNRAFFELRRELSQLDFYADKAAKTESGQIAYRYCSEKELASGLEPVLFKHGFTMLFGQRDENERTVAIITLIHADGHEETREYSVRSGATNRMKDATAADTGATTSAWRHLVIKMFGLKSRIREEDDPRNLGETNAKVTSAQAEELERRVNLLNSNVAAFLKLAGATSFADIPANNYEVMDRMLQSKEKASR